jgi:response regulator RpfG family c-di-GMP phosphodiesterase/DNA-binding CsgD family transcriptional regulator
LLKPGPLTLSEYAEMQRHAQIGFQLLAGGPSVLMEQAARVAHAHHEWWDGGGYPLGLQGEEIPETARLAAVTDVFDALTSDRVYRPAYAVDEALAMMQALRGRQFEPRLLDAFLSSIDAVLEVQQEYPDAEDAARIRVLVVDDHEIFAESLVRLLGVDAGIKVVGRASSVAEAVREAVAYAPDVVLMDYELPDGTGIAATRQVRAALPRCKVVMLTGRSDEYALAQAVDAGCVGFVTKGEGSDTLIAAVKRAHADEPLSPLGELVPMLQDLRRTNRGLGSALGPRELEILGLVAEGLSNKDIAGQLTVSVNTVRNHVQNLLRKLNAHSKLEAIATAVREGILVYTRGSA